MNKKKTNNESGNGRKDVSTIKVVEKKDSEIEQTDKKLSDAEMLQIEVFARDIMLAEKEHELANEQVRREEYHRDMLKLKLDNVNLSIKDLMRLRNALERNKIAQQTKHLEYMKELTKKYELPDRWGFNHETGEIILSKK